MKFNINLIDPNVLGQFNQIKTEDGLWLYQFVDDKPAHVVINGIRRDWKDNQSFSVDVYRENRTIKAIVNVLRTSANYYTVNGYKNGKTFSQRCSNVEDVSNYIKTKFCRTLLNKEEIEK